MELAYTNEKNPEQHLKTILFTGHSCNY